MESVTMENKILLQSIPMEQLLYWSEKKFIKVQTKKLVESSVKPQLFKIEMFH